MKVRAGQVPWPVAFAEDVPAGTIVDVYLWYWKFAPPKDLTVGYELVLAVGSPPEVWWSSTGALPTESDVLYARFRAPAALSHDVPVYWHIANHGANVWEFVRFGADLPLADSE